MRAAQSKKNHEDHEDAPPTDLVLSQSTAHSAGCRAWIAMPYVLFLDRRQTENATGSSSMQLSRSMQ